MNAYEINEKALKFLDDGNFTVAQELLRKNCRSKDYRAFNNLGYFYLENGLTLSNGKTISGIGIGKRYIKKSCDIRKTSTVLSNLAMVMFQYEQDYDASLKLYKESYGKKEDDDVLYNMGVCLYKFKKYKEVTDLFSIDSLTQTDTFLLYAFSILHYDKKQFIKLIESKNLTDMEIDEDIIIILRMLAYDTVALNDINEYLNDWSPDEYMWAVTVDALIKNNVSAEEIKMIIKEKTEGYCDKKVMSKKALNYLNSSDERCKKISSQEYFSPVPRTVCGYYGCLKHHTPWNQ